VNFVGGIFEFVLLDATTITASELWYLRSSEQQQQQQHARTRTWNMVHGAPLH